MEDIKEEGLRIVRIKRNPEKGFDFDFEIIIPTVIREDANLLMSFCNGFSEREKYLLELLKAPIMIPYTNKNQEDDKGNRFNFDQFDLDALVDENGNERVFRNGTNLSIIKQYRNAISEAYRVLKEEKVIKEDKEEKVDVEGYSYHGTRAQRFGMLLPEKIRSVFVGGAYSSIPIPLETLNGKSLNYPTGFKGLEKALGEETTDRVLKDYKDILQIIYVTENELKYDGSFTIDGKRMRDSSSGERLDYSGITVSQHDISPDVLNVVMNQIDLFGTDINDRANGVLDIIRNQGCNLAKTKIYEGVDHHWSEPSKRILSLLDMTDAIISMDAAQRQGITSLRNINVEGFVGGVDRIDTSFESKRTSLQSLLVGENVLKEDFETAAAALVSKMVQDKSDDAFLYTEPKKFMYDFDSEIIRKAREMRDEEKRSVTAKKGFLDVLGAAHKDVNMNIDGLKNGYATLENSIRFENRDGKIDEQTHIGE